MAADVHHVDGNAVAALLTDVFGTDMTSAPRGCASCGTTHAVAEHRAYLGAGVVLRCPSCDDVAMVATAIGSTYEVELRGVWRLSVPAT